MEYCPTCGARLTGRLIAAIADPNQEESCPTEIRRKMKSRRKSEGAMYEDQRNG